MIKEAIEKIVMRQDLTYDEAYAVMNEIMSGETSQTQNAAFLAALSTKSTKAETIDEITGCANAMREHATPVPHPQLPASRWPSMATGQRPPLPGQPMSSRLLASTWTRARTSAWNS